MKTLLGIALLTIICFADDVKQKPVDLSGTVLQILEHGVIIDAAVDESGLALDVWRGRIFLIGHPKQKTMAEGDEMNGIQVVRVGNWRDGSSVLRAYKFIGSRYKL